MFRQTESSVRRASNYYKKLTQQMRNPNVTLPRCMKCRHGLAMRKLFVSLSVRLSVCPSAKRVHCDKTEERSV